MSGISEFTSAFFDASSKAWKKNKVKYDQACYTYKKGAFKEIEDIPTETPSKSALLRNEREVKKRMALQEEAPLPVRKSPRLQAEHRKQTYV